MLHLLQCNRPWSPTLNLIVKRISSYLSSVRTHYWPFNVVLLGIYFENPCYLPPFTTGQRYENTSITWPDLSSPTIINWHKREIEPVSSPSFLYYPASAFTMPPPLISLQPPMTQETFLYSHYKCKHRPNTDCYPAKWPVGEAFSMPLKITGCGRNVDDDDPSNWGGTPNRSQFRWHRFFLLHLSKDIITQTVQNKPMWKIFIGV